MSESKENKEGNTVIVIAVILIVFVILMVAIKKIISLLNTETPVLDEPSKKILSDKKLVEDYYLAIEKEKRGEKSNITIEGEEYKIVRAGKHQPVTTQ